MKKQFFAKHAKSSAIFISVAVHAVLLILAISMVAISVITKEDVGFEAKQVKRPRMMLRKLQVPVNVKKPPRQPKLRKQIVATPKINRMPDIKMPEIVGVKGGMGAGGGGVGAGGSLGFSMPEINMFGIKSQGERVFIILDSTPWMMYDELGGIPAYALIKDELVRILGELNSMVLFNVAVYGQGTGTHVLFQGLAPANAANVAKAEAWLKPLNAVKAGGYGTHTLGAGGARVEESLIIPPLENLNHWSEPLMYAMKQRVDTVVLLANGWGHINCEKAPAKAWSESKIAKYKELERRAREKLDEENRLRKANGQPERVLVGGSIINEYFPGTEHPPQAELYWYSPREIAQACVNQRKANSEKSGLDSKSKKAAEKFAFSIVQFIPEDTGVEEERFRQLARIFNGEYRSMAGLEAIESYLSDSGDRQ